MKKIVTQKCFIFPLILMGLFWLLETTSVAQSLLGLSDLGSFEKLVNGKSHFSIDTDGDIVVIGDYHSSTK